MPHVAPRPMLLPLLLGLVIGLAGGILVGIMVGHRSAPPRWQLLALTLMQGHIGVYLNGEPVATVVDQPAASTVMWWFCPGVRVQTGVMSYVLTIPQLRQMMHDDHSGRCPAPVRSE